MKFYAYKPDSIGREPMGTADKLLFELKTYKGAIRRAIRILGKRVEVFRYTDFYRASTHTRIY